MIKADGLDDGHKIIKLNSCWGAGGGKGQNVDSHNSFAAQLAYELGRIGYKKIRVGGYHGELQRVGDEGKKLVIDGKEKTPASRVDRLWFGPDGLEVTNDPDIDEIKDKKDQARENFENVNKSYPPFG
jgi:hypothetical protein